MLPSEYQVGQEIRFQDCDGNEQVWVIDSVIGVNRSGTKGVMLQMHPLEQGLKHSPLDRIDNFQPLSLKDRNYDILHGFTTKIKDDWP